MFKFLFASCVMFTLLLQANNIASDEETLISNDEMFINSECDTMYDKCILECEEKDGEATTCYSKCEELYEDCLLKKEL